MNLKRTINSIQFVKNGWDTLGIPYTIKHGTYTTILESELGKHKFMINSYSNRVFVAKNKVLKDLQNSDLAKEIMQGDYQTNNFGIQANLTNLHSKDVLNIDISSAYPHAIYNAGLITQETFEYLNTLKKGEKLPALGMLASAHTKLFYEKGKVVKYIAHREPTAQIFYCLIQEINDLMEECKWVLGSDYIFHWVDGVFFKKSTSVKKINQVEKIFQDMHFPYKYESVKNFNLRKDEENFVISMIKNGESKTYEFTHRNEHKRIKRYLAQQIKGEVYTP